MKRFTGWRHSEKLGKDYRKRFTRQLSRTAKAELVSKTVSKANLSIGRAAQFPASVLPGLLFRDSLPASYIPPATVAGDFNGDGKLDFAVANGGDNNLWLYFGKGDCTFNWPIILQINQGKTPTWIATGDLRGVGRTDLVVAEPDSNSVGVFLGNSDGTFAESSISIPGAATTLVVGDFNHDGQLDIVVRWMTATRTSTLSCYPEPVTERLGRRSQLRLVGTRGGSFGLHRRSERRRLYRSDATN